jgi:squalene-associated FAD-dependent desaturase
MAETHIIGAGLAGLACAVALAKRGRRVVLYEAARQAGGRCRSFHDETLDRVIDNGNHLMLSGNWAVMDYLATIGARDTLLSPEHARIPFFDLETGERWTLRPNAGPIGWWIFATSRRVPGSRAGDYLQALRLARAPKSMTVAECFDTDRPLYRRLWEPLAVAALNTSAEEGAARLLWPVVRETMLKGEAYMRPCIARDGLSDSLVAPALAFLEAQGSEIRLGARARTLVFGNGRATAIETGQATVDLGTEDAAVIAVPPAAAQTLLPDCPAPTDSRAIVNAHFRLDAPIEPPPDMADAPLLGLIGGVAHWLFLRGEIASVTISAAEEHVDTPAETLAPRIWADVARALDIPDAPMPPVRIVKEKRATFAQTPEALDLRPGAPTSYRNLFLAGDWTDTGLPATIEGAVRSGLRAAEAVLAL